MKDLSALVIECKSVLTRLSIPFVDCPVTLNNRAVRRAGTCKRKNGGFHIEISSLILADTASENGVCEVILHEYLHTCSGCFNHGKKWKAYADKIKRAFPQYNVERTIDFDTLGIEEPEVLSRYCVACEKCGYEVTRSKMSALIQHPEEYIHTGCGGHFTRKR